MNKSIFNKLFPNNDKTDEYISLYCFYLKELEKYLNKVLFLRNLNENIKSSYVETNNIFKRISSLNLESVFLLNKLLLDNLTTSELDKLKELYQTNNETEMFIKDTYKKVLDNNGVLIIGISVEPDERITSYVNNLANEYLQILNIPVKIENIKEIEEQRYKEILEKYPKHIPIGSLVLLKEGKRKVMVIGYGGISLDNKDEVYDYIGCLYPEGVISDTENLVFNHEDIKRLIAIGYTTNEQKEFIKKINYTFKNKKELLKILKEELN